MPSTQRHVLVGSSPSLRSLSVEIGIAARSQAKILLTGETGVGKEVVAHEIHRRSRRADRPFVAINCAGVPDTLLESELFGHARGSFTGAVRDHPGLLREAERGTVFLDEVGEMSLRMQAAFLRFLETGELQTVGSGTARTRVDVRVITATNRPLSGAIAQGGFREDLYYRLNVLKLHIPPLRERADDVPLLLEHFASRFAHDYSMVAPTFTPAAVAVLSQYPWPGNVRELRNVVERMVSRGGSPWIDVADLPADIVAGARSSPTALPPEPALPSRVHAMLERMLEQKESFWTTVYPTFMSRDLTRDDLRAIVRYGLEEAQGSYRMLLPLFNMSDGDYKRFLGFLKQHDCHVPFQAFRVVRRPGYGVRSASGAGA